MKINILHLYLFIVSTSIINYGEYAPNTRSSVGGGDGTAMTIALSQCMPEQMCGNGFTKLKYNNVYRSFYIAISHI